MEQVMEEIKKPTRKRKKRYIPKTERYQAISVNQLQVKYNPEVKAFEVVFWAKRRQKEVLFSSPNSKQEAVGWAMRRAWWAKAGADVHRYCTLVREFLLEPYEKRILEQGDGFHMEEISQNTVVIYKHSEKILRLTKLGKDVLVEFYKGLQKAVHREIINCEYIPYAAADKKYGESCKYRFPI